MKIKREEYLHFEETPTNIMHITILATILAIFGFMLYILYKLDTLIGEKLSGFTDVLTAIIIISFIGLLIYLLVYWQKGTEKHMLALKKHKQIYKLHWSGK